ncbi:MAG: DNA replication/repair protein RecF [Lentisphaeraceae bacterium]|nr:DNA replication/repair protein RecF [Lentisphaeraceae bacterium]
MGYLSKLTLENFRNYSKADLSFSPGLTIFHGENGQGKTSLLESIYFLSLLRSFRTRNVQHLKSWQTEAFDVSCVLEHEDLLADHLQVTYGDKRKLQINGNAVSRSSEFIRQINAISFTPEDIELIKGSAGGRRQFFDIVLSQLSPNYLINLQNYNKALKSRNVILRNDQDGESQDSLLKTYEQLLIQYGSKICYERLALLKKLEPKITQFTKEMFPENKKLKLIYQSTLGKNLDDEEALRELYTKKSQDSRAKDLSRGMTHIGPHRDDIFILLSGKSLGAFGSEGQCRLASLVLKMAAAEQLIEDSQTDNVLLLIDDVLGELDGDRKEAFLRTIMRGDQVFIACTDIPEYCQSLDYNLYNVEEGTVSLQEE